jgi:hypothetical protein
MEISFIGMTIWTNDISISFPRPTPCDLKCTSVPFMQITRRGWCNSSPVGFLLFVLAHLMNLGFSYTFTQGEEFPFPTMLQ